MNNETGSSGPVVVQFFLDLRYNKCGGEMPSKVTSIRNFLFLRKPNWEEV